MSQIDLFKKYSFDRTVCKKLSEITTQNMLVRTHN